ncbi:MAG TPA: UDP-N-acetylmuramoyl-L-alanyl-D-glutamate--2,6-diaminopimelate ligase [Solirubrobacteraceae bacterium]|jgi:UDP-N-acetylmuramoyl-L-alanyl-D-glutamate--2,6-diaminopimelate ligase|nr:UDP-N-acetylmuramoyl-L-alanyl-D-glutamate--2,6-diaminopimelate ligase [Solirubrobacteraceae bacterium]
MTLQELAGAGIPGLLGVSPTPEPVAISSLAYDSRAVVAGALFFCVPGHERDGHEFARAAVDSGARALVVERSLGLGVPELLVDSVRAAMGPLAACFYGDPTASLRVIGVTGTNGKTTTAHLVRGMLEARGERCGLLGTVRSVIGGREHPAVRTTPEAIDLQRAFRAMIDGGETHCVMEVSSHALALGRTAGTRFAAAIFTNLTQDHLDFHATMEDYFQAKRLLFAPEDPGARPAISVVNLDDPYGRRLAGELEQPVTFAIEADDADYLARDVRIDLSGSRCTLLTPAGERPLALPLAGRFNVANALAALAACHSLGGELDALVAALERGVQVPGRLQAVTEGQGFAVLVDYAHTPDSLQNVLSAAHDLGDGRVICVFGAGGDRDRGKRPLMGEIGARLADVLLVTSDNPRSEDPEAIVAEIMAGADAAARPPHAEPVLAEVDRRAAIERAVSLARDGDVLVIAGKGHEQGQELAGGVKVPFDDVTVAREALRCRRLGAGGERPDAASKSATSATSDPADTARGRR